MTEFTGLDCREVGESLDWVTSLPDGMRARVYISHDELGFIIYEGVGEEVRHVEFRKGEAGASLAIRCLVTSRPEEIAKFEDALYRAKNGDFSGLQPVK